MSELQQDDGGYLIEQEDDLPETEGQLESEESEEPGSESAPDSGNSAHEKQVEFTEEQQRIFNEAVGKRFSSSVKKSEKLKNSAGDLKNLKLEFPSKDGQ